MVLEQTFAVKLSGHDEVVRMSRTKKASVLETVGPIGNPKGAVLLIHSWWGLTESFRKYGASLAEAGYTVGLVDLFDGKTAETEAEARALRALPRRTPIYKTLGADIEILRATIGTKGPGIGVVGFSMGGHWAVWLSQRAEYRVAATVLYYAARSGDFSNCHSGIIAHYADEDPWVSRSARRNMERAIRKAGCDYRAFDYPRTQHWFAESARPSEFKENMALLALQRDLEHIGKHLIL